MADQPFKDINEAIALLTSVSAKIADAAKKQKNAAVPKKVAAIKLEPKKEAKKEQKKVNVVTATKEKPAPKKLEKREKDEKPLQDITKKFLDFVKKTAKKDAPAAEKIVEEPKPVIITGFGKPAQDFLKSIKSKKKKEKEDDTVQDLPFMTLIKKLTGGALVVLGGLAALVTGLMSNGPLKGLLIFLAKYGPKTIFTLVQGVFSKAISSLESNLSKFLPTLSFPEIAKSLKSKAIDLIKEVKKPIASMLSGLSKAITAGIPSGGFVSKAVSAISSEFKKAFGGLLYAPIKAIGKLNLGMFAKAASGASKLIKPALKVLPLIGSFISWASAATRFKTGDIVGGSIDLISGITSLVPGVGTALSIGLDAFNAILDWKGNKGDPGERTATKLNLIGSWTSSLWKMWNKLPLVKNFAMFGEGFGEVLASGGNLENVKDGLLKMAWAVPGFGILSNIITGISSYKEAKEITAGSGEKFRDTFGQLVESLKKKALMLIPESVFGFSLRARVAKTFGIDMGPIVDDKLQTAKSDKTKLPQIQQVNDFIQTPSGKVIQPSKDDTIIGAKAGGVFDKHFGETLKLAEENNDILQDLSSSSTSLLSRQVELIAESNKFLRQMAENMKKMGTNIVTNNSIVNNASKGMSLRELQTSNT